MYFIPPASPPGSTSALHSPLWPAAAIGIGILLFFRGFPYLKRKHLIQNTPTSTVRGAALGAVEVHGKVVGPYTLISPLSESDCFYYRAIARSTEEEKTTSEEVLYVPFFLDDGTGRLLVDPRGAELDIRPTVEQEYSPSSSDAFCRRFLVRRGISSERAANLQEYCIREGDDLYILGYLLENPRVEAEPGLLSAAAADLQRRAAIESMYPPGSAVPRAPKAKPADAEPFDLDPEVLLMKGAAGKPFFISWRSQRDIVEELAWRSVVYIWGGPLLALAGLWLLIGDLLAS